MKKRKAKTCKWDYGVNGYYRSCDPKGNKLSKFCQYCGKKVGVKK